MSGPKRPLPCYGWVEVTRDFARYLPTPDSLAFQRRGGLCVISSLAGMEAPDSSGDILPTWLVSCSRRGRSMPTDEDMKAVRCAFGMSEAEEDNHEPGNARKLFLVVDPARRVACECKTDERVIVRPDGYRYSVKGRPS